MSFKFILTNFFGADNLKKKNIRRLVKQLVRGV